MKVAMLNRPPADQGGDRIALGYTIAALKRAGVEAVHVYGENLAGRLAGFDLAHCFHIDFDWAVVNYEACRRIGLPYVSTPILYPEIQNVLKSRAAAAIAGARAIFTFTTREGEELRAKYGAHLSYTPIPNGTAAEFHAEPSEDRIGVCAVDWVGFKNGNAIAKACEALKIPFALLSSVSHDRMPAEYRRFRMFCSATPSDRMSLAVGEALCSGCRCIVSTANRGNEWYPGLQTIHPLASIGEWRDRIERAYKAPEWEWMPNHAARMLTWDKAAEALKREYERVLA